MKKVFLSLALSSVLLLTVTSCGSNASKDSTSSPAQEAALFQCPMHCEGDKTYSEPGKCPKCGMDLKPVETAAPADSTHATGDSVKAV